MVLYWGYMVLYSGYIGIMEKDMETTISCFPNGFARLRRRTLEALPAMASPSVHGM